MINDVLEFIGKSSIEVMIGEGIDTVEVQFNANTTNNTIELKIENKELYSLKVKHISNTLSKQDLGFLMNKPISFVSKANISPNSDDYEKVREEGGEILVKIIPKDEFATKFLEGFSRHDAEILIPANQIAKFNNPRL